MRRAGLLEQTRIANRSTASSSWVDSEA